jgi:hypothetical protein
VKAKPGLVRTKKKSVKIKEGTGSASFMKSKGENQTHDNIKI